MATGRVLQWDEEAGWGVVESPAFDGPIWTHFSHVEISDSPGGYRRLVPGAAVEVLAERADQDGYRWRATRVRPV